MCDDSFQNAVATGFTSLDHIISQTRYSGELSTQGKSCDTPLYRMRKNSADSSSGRGILGPTVFVLPSPTVSTSSSSRKSRNKWEGKTKGGNGCLLIVGLSVLLCLHTIWQVKFQLILENHAKRALDSEASHVYTMLRHRLPHSASTTSVNKETTSYFHSAASKAYSRIAEREENKNKTDQQRRTKFDVSTWTLKTAQGLLQDDRVMLGKIYSQANSVFEFGLGESSYIANHVGVQRFSGIDSDVTSISTVREKVNGNYRFYFADVGMTGDWGTPTEQLNKAAYDYQVVPLLAEPKAFDVYMLDGRFRVGCLLMSFLHASSSLHKQEKKSKQQRRRRNQDNNDDDNSHDDDDDDAVIPRTTAKNSPIVLVHDCWRAEYHVADHLLELIEHTTKNGGNTAATDEKTLEHDGMSLCAYKRKITTTDAQLYELWSKLFQNIA